MIVLRWSAFLLLVFGASAFAYITYYGGAESWRPASLPMPGVGYKVATPFEVKASGLYRVEVEVPVIIDKQEPVGMVDVPPIACDLLLEVEGPGNLKFQQPISRLARHARFYFGNIDYYYGPSFNLPETGRYTLRISNRTTSPTLQERGASIALVRDANSKDVAVGWLLLQAIAWFAVILGILLTIVCEYLLRKRLRAAS